MNHSSITSEISDRAERGVLASMLRWPACIDDVSMRLRPDDMRHDAHQKIYRVILSLQGRKQVDLVTLAEELHTRGELKNIGGAPFLAEMYDSEPTGGNALYYADIVREAFLRRSLSYLGREIIDEAETPTDSAVNALERFEQSLWGLSEFSVNGQATTLDADYDAVMDLSDARSSGELGDELPTGFQDLDAILTGLRPSQLTIIAARPSCGKTALGLSIARNLTVGFNTPVLFSSLEQSRHELAARNVCGHARVNGHWLNAGRLSREEAVKVSDAVRVLKRAPLFVDDEANQTCHRIAANARRLVRRSGVRALFVDYLQMVTPENKKAQRYEQVGEVSRRLKGIAKELKIPVVALAQLGRGADEVREPKLSDLRESGNIEADADVVILLHKEREKEIGQQDDNLVKAIVAKHRNGPQGRVTLFFRKESVCFENYSDEPFK